jgi:hypothetical protein
MELDLAILPDPRHQRPFSVGFALAELNRDERDSLRAILVRNSGLFVVITALFAGIGYLRQ